MSRGAPIIFDITTGACQCAELRTSRLRGVSALCLLDLLEPSKWSERSWTAQAVQVMHICTCTMIQFIPAAVAITTVHSTVHTCQCR